MRNPEMTKRQGKTVERSEMQQWHMGLMAETATTRRLNKNKVPTWRMATIFEEGDDDHEWHWRVELRTPITSGKRRNTRSCMRFSDRESQNKSEVLLGYEK
jgi:hypothetical protein